MIESIQGEEQQENQVWQKEICFHGWRKCLAESLQSHKDHYRLKRKEGRSLGSQWQKLANNLNVFYTHFDQWDFYTQQTQAMEKVQDQPAQPFVINAGFVLSQ